MAALYANEPGAAKSAIIPGMGRAPLAKGRTHATEASKWALVPDATDPKSWRLPLFYEGESKPDPGLVAYAIGRLSPDAHPTLDVRHARGARQRVRDAFRILYPDRELPGPLTKAQEVSFDPTTEAADSGTGVMVAFGLAPAIAEALAVKAEGLGDGIAVEPTSSLHVTLCYMGPIAEWPTEKLDQLRAVLATFAPYEWPMEGVISGGAIFDVGEDAETGRRVGAAVALVDAPNLSAWRTRLATMLAGYGLAAANEHDFTAHVTLAYGPLDQLQSVPLPPTIGVYFDALMLVAGPDVQTFPLDGPRLAAAEAAMYPHDEGPQLILASAEKRFTLAPLYVPGELDSHKEWADADDLQAMVWDYVQAGDRTVRLQHVPGTIAGESLEIVCWPFELTAPMLQADGSTVDVTLPPGTVYQGIRWEPWAFQSIRAGELNGISMGGAAYRTNEAPPGGDPDASQGS